MKAYLFARSLQLTLTLLALSLAVFLSLHATGDPALYLISPEATTEQYMQARERLGLDKPLIVQYGVFLTQTVRGDFGRSIVSGRPVIDVLMERFPHTFQLAGVAMVLIVVLGIPLGVLSAVKRNSILDHAGRFFAVLGMAAPSFWVAIMAILLFGATLRWLPTFGTGSLSHIILPSAVVAWPGIAGMMRLVRSSMLEVLGSEYVRFARSKGLHEWVVIYKHALKNALGPALTFGGLALAGLLNGTVVVEVVFAWPGIGQVMLLAIQRRDFPVVQATVLAAAFFYIVLAFLVDVGQVYVNPRLRHR